MAKLILGAMLAGSVFGILFWETAHGAERVRTVGRTTYITGPQGTTQVRPVGRTVTITRPDGRRVHCRQVGKNLVCTGDKK
jgi:hypothetical protein